MGDGARIRTYTPEVSDQDPDLPLSSPAAAGDGAEPGAGPPPGSEPLPEFLNPESIHYQPWAEKQLSNASKEKRPLADFMAEMEERLNSYGTLPEMRWDPERQEHLLDRFAASVPGRSRRRHRRRTGAAGAAAAAPAEARPGGARGQRRRRKPVTLAATPQPSPGAPAAAPSERRRRRRRRRPRTGEGSGPAAPSA